jgi:tRNA A-37 threonylcarbamoyl transferase component Bud32
VFAPGSDGGALTVNATFAEPFARAGLSSASALLDLPGEVVSGHPDRHVMRVTVPGAPNAFYLKRQHVVGWREKWRNRRGGFGWVSRCEREAELLRQLESACLPAPRWSAFGKHGSRAFLLVEEVPGAVDLRRILSEGVLSPVERRALAARIGAALARIHATGFTTPDLTAKHVLVHPETLTVTFLDWPSSSRRAVNETARIDALGALHASLAPGLASRAERMRALRTYAPTTPAVKVLQTAARHANRRSVRDQLQLNEGNAQRLVWLAGEAVCAVPEIAAQWPRLAIAPPFYGFGPDGASQVRFAGRDAILVRGRCSAPLGRFRARLRSMPWRSPGVTIGRVLFHLERYGVPAPRLFAFGQRLTGITTAEWFALYETPSGVPLRTWRRTAPLSARREVLETITGCLAKLHAAGCVLIDPRSAFALDGGTVSIADPRTVRIVRSVSASARRRDLRGATRLLGVA